jgi:hypothetical protein
MKISTIRNTWLAGMAIIVVGLIISGISLGMMLAYGGQWVPQPYSPNNWNFYPTFSPFFWGMVSIMITGGVIMMAGGVAQLVAWIGAMINTYRLESKMWFLLLLIGGLIGVFSFVFVGWAVMIAYLIAQPDAALSERLASPALPILPYTPQPDEPAAQPKTPVPVS